MNIPLGMLPSSGCSTAMIHMVVILESMPRAVILQQVPMAAIMINSMPSSGVAEMHKEISCTAGNSFFEVLAISVASVHGVYTTLLPNMKLHSWHLYRNYAARY